MDIGVLRGILTATILVLFLGIWVWSWSRKRRQDFDAAAALPLSDDTRPPNNVMNKEQSS
ncbi:MAG: cbb3-type cytochrome c oxidase subunit 3 [Gammaproteobacteria bacterium]|nr:cbb3-type cytochrome c oxidase subunit 3 [Gammaproteobacteria bacterium]MDH5302670.1 cbb3-type cytochrome c oxidase subunit 3 [Gammaproteobacteria bacterium]MDH5320893.1 cbb3-type cytochrome c oxidase subunit 3 [Gammaproteobacteria bacterium]